MTCHVHVCTMKDFKGDYCFSYHCEHRPYFMSATVLLLQCRCQPVASPPPPGGLLVVPSVSPSGENSVVAVRLESNTYCRAMDVHMSADGSEAVILAMLMDVRQHGPVWLKACKAKNFNHHPLPSKRARGSRRTISTNKDFSIHKPFNRYRCLFKMFKVPLGMSCWSCRRPSWA